MGRGFGPSPCFKMYILVHFKETYGVYPKETRLLLPQALAIKLALDGVVEVIERRHVSMKETR